MNGSKFCRQMEDVGVIEADLSVYGWTLKIFFFLMLPLKGNTTLCLDDFTTSRSGATLFSTLDAERAFCQI